jgi:hypothetical protein
MRINFFKLEGIEKEAYEAGLRDGYEAGINYDHDVEFEDHTYTDHSDARVRFIYSEGFAEGVQNV